MDRLFPFCSPYGVTKNLRKETENLIVSCRPLCENRVTVDSLYMSPFLTSGCSSRLSLALGLLAGLAMPIPGSASILATTSFEDNTLGALSGQAGGIGWTGTWTAPGNVTRAEVVDTTGNPLDFTPGGGLPVDGATRALEVQLSGAAASQLCGVRTLALPIAQTFYVAYLVRYHAGAAWASGNNTFTLHLGTNATQAGTLNFGLRGNTAAGSDEFMLRFGTGAPATGASTGGQVITGTDYYLVARVNYSSGAFTSANLWLNPGATDDVDTPAGDAVLSGFSSPAITHIFFRQAALETDDVLRADEIRIGTAWSDVVPSSVSTNPPPSVSLTNPVNGASFLAPANILLEATASDSNGTVTNVAFYAGTTKLADDATEPFSYNWTGVSAGNYALTAVATDDVEAFRAPHRSSISP